MKHVLLRNNTLVNLTDGYEANIYKAKEASEFYSLFIDPQICPDSSGPTGTHIYLAISDDDKPIPYPDNFTDSHPHDIVRVFKDKAEVVAWTLLNS